MTSLFNDWVSWILIDTANSSFTFFTCSNFCVATFAPSSTPAVSDEVVVTISNIVAVTNDINCEACKLPAFTGGNYTRRVGLEQGARSINSNRNWSRSNCGLHGFRTVRLRIILRTNKYNPFRRCISAIITLGLSHASSANTTVIWVIALCANRVDFCIVPCLAVPSTTTFVISIIAGTVYQLLFRIWRMQASHLEDFSWLHWSNCRKSPIWTTISLFFNWLDDTFVYPVNRFRISTKLYIRHSCVDKVW